MIQLEIDLLKQMLQGDLAIASRMLEIGDLTMCADAISGAASKLERLKALVGMASTPSQIEHAIDV